MGREHEKHKPKEMKHLTRGTTKPQPDQGGKGEATHGVKSDQRSRLTDANAHLVGVAKRNVPHDTADMPRVVPDIQRRTSRRGAGSGGRRGLL